MKSTTRNYLIMVIIGILLGGLAVYDRMKPVEDTAQTANIAFTVPFKIHTLESRDYVFHFTDRQPIEGTTYKEITVPENPTIMTENEIDDIRKQYIENDSANHICGEIQSGNSEIIYTNDNGDSAQFKAVYHDRKTGETWSFTFSNMTVDEVVSIVQTIRKRVV